MGIESPRLRRRSMLPVAGGLQRQKTARHFWETKTWQPIGITREADDSFARKIVAGPGDERITLLR